MIVMRPMRLIRFPPYGAAKLSRQWSEQALQAAASQAADTIKAACPNDVPATPPARLAAVGQRLHAMLQGVETMQPPLADFYNSLSDDQKARFNSMGRQLFAQNAGNQSSNE